MPFSVLTVDDDAATHLVLSLLIQIENRMAASAPAFNGHEALERVAAECPDVIISDVNMPGLGGLQALPLMRDACPEAVIALYSSHPAARTGLHLGADAVFDKSADDPAEMLSELLRLYETAGRRKDG